jgi:outer membrane receptor for ferrienterochelin and colicin
MSLKSSLCGPALVIAAGGAALCAQGTQTASVTVTTVDKSGTAVSGARVLLTSPSMMAERSGVTNSAGTFVVRLLPPGTYTIEVVRAGYQTVRVTRAVGVDQHYQPRIIMDAIASADVSVVASSDASIDPTNVKTASNYGSSRIDLLPVARTIEGMVALTPGVVAGVGGRTQIRGAMTSGNLYLVDGQNLMDNVYSNMQYPILSDSIEETQVITGAISAEYGGVDGGVVNTITKSGSNEFSGQLRFDFQNPAWDASRPHQQGKAPNELSWEMSLALGGYFIKDRLWFHVSYYTADLHKAEVIGGGAPVNPRHPDLGGNALYANDISDQRWQAKLTFLVNPDHCLVATYNRADSDEARGNDMAGDINALVPKTSAFDFWNLAWRATWSPSFTTELRLGQKHQLYTRWKGHEAQGVGPIHSVGMGRGFYYNMGIGGDDGGDARDNSTANFKGSYYLDLAGEHEIDAGAEYYKGSRRSRNVQSPWHNRVITVDDYRYAPQYWDPPNNQTPNPYYGRQEAVPVSAVQYSSSDATASQQELGFFINDAWKVNDHFSLQLGLRWEGYYAEADDTGGIASAAGLSPRLGVSFDPFGDQRWLFKASYCRYDSRVLEVITGVVSACGNPPYVRYNYRGPKGWQALDEIVYNYSLYYHSQESPGQVSGYYYPSKTVLIDPELEAPTCDEVQVSASYSFDFEEWGKGFLSLTYVGKEWKNLIDIRAGYDGVVSVSDFLPGYDQDMYTYYTRWGNEPDAKREYRAFELSGAYSVKGLNFTGNVTWSSLRGNYEGEGALSPGAGENLHYMDSFRDRDGVWHDAYDSAELHPYGYLTGHVPLAVRLTADYTTTGRLGKTTFGWSYRFDSGQRYSHVRTVNSKYLNAAFDKEGAASAEAMAFDTVFTQYEDSRRNPYAYNSSSYHDLSAAHEIPLMSIRSAKVRLFAKMAIGNVFNHQQLLTWNTDFESIGITTHIPSDAENFRDMTWIKPDTFGNTRATSYWGAARTYTLSAGLRF